MENQGRAYGNLLFPPHCVRDKWCYIIRYRNYISPSTLLSSSTKESTLKKIGGVRVSSVGDSTPREHIFLDNNFTKFSTDHVLDRER